MANTLTGLIPVLYQALDTIAREMVGFIPAVTRNSTAEAAAVGQTITFPIVPASLASDVTPATYANDDGDMTLGNASLTISKSRYVPVRWTGEEQRGVQASGQYQNILRDQFTQAMRTLVNEVESDLAGLYTSASRASGTAGTTPFGTAGDFSDFAAQLQILDDNGCPATGRQLVLGSAAIANLRGKQSVLFKVNEAGTEQLLREGIIGRVEGFDIHTSAQVKSVTKGAGAGYLVSGTPAAKATALTTSTGSGAINAGDIVTIAGDSNNYVVGTGQSAPGALVLNNPGLVLAHANGDAITVGNSYRANMAFHRSALQLVTRVPAMPEGGDAADDMLVITDPVSGLSFQVTVYRQYRRVKYEIALAWGVKAVKSEFMSILRG
jgi:P22 coat protein - gene protein 5